MPEFNPLAAVQQGQSWIDGLFAQRAQREAGAALAGGNYGQAANTLFRSGNLAAGQGVRDQERSNVLAQRADVDAAKAARDAQRAEQLQATLQITGALRRVRDQGGDVTAELPRYRQTFIAMGTDPAQLQQIEQQIASNPAFLDQIENITGQQLRELSFQKAGDQLLVFEQGNPDPIRQFTPPRQPIEVGGVLVDPETYEPLIDTREAKTATVSNTDGSSSIVAIDPSPIRAGGGRSSGGGSGYLPPVAGAQTSGYGSRTAPALTNGRRGSSNHQGLDFRAAEGDPVASAQAGVVTFAGPRGGYGNRVEITHPDGRVTSYSHLSNVGVRVGQEVGQGVPIGAAGSTGNVTGPHVHFEVTENGQRIDPSRIFGGGERQPQRVSQPQGQGARVVASGANNGLSASQQRAEEGANRDDLRAQSQLRREFNGRQEVRDFREVESAYNNVRAAAANPSAAGDLSMIFAYMKMLDPGSVVREQEFANAQNAAGVPDRIRNQYNRVLNGQRLNPNQRNDFVSQAERLYGARRDTFGRVENEYRQEAELSGYDPNRIAPQRPESSQRQRNRPALGFTPTEAQTARRRQIVPDGQPSGAAPGTARNPYIINPNSAASSRNNVPSGALFIDTDGQIKRKR